MAAVDEFDSSDSETSSLSGDSDAELQRDFASGKLKVGLNQIKKRTRVQRQFLNNVPGLKQKLEQMKLNLKWAERMDITSQESENIEGEASTDTSAVHDDFKREMKFYKQAQEAMQLAVPKLHKLGILTKRPDDYFAEMVKTDDHMQRVRSKLLNKQNAMERSEKAKKQREMKKYGKKVQQEVLQKRQKEKKEMLEAVKKYKKGKQQTPNFIKGDSFNVQTEKQNPGGSKDSRQKRGKPMKRDSKNKKFGFGGKKRGVKRNTASSTSDVSSFNSAKHSVPGKKRKLQRPGKSKRNKRRKT